MATDIDHDPEAIRLQRRLQRTVAIFAEALERRHRKIAAGQPVDPPLRCTCRKCSDADHR